MVDNGSSPYPGSGVIRNLYSPSVPVSDFSSVNTPYVAADPGFLRRGTNPRGGRQPINWPIFAENCMKTKKFGLRGGGASSAPPSRYMYQ